MKRFLELLLNLSPGELAGADDWWPSLEGLPSNNWAVLGIILAAGVLVWLTVRSYLREGQVARRAKLGLAGVRIAVILLVLVTLLEPAIVLRRVRTDYSSVVVLVDDSLSMSLADRFGQGNSTQPSPRRAALAARLGVSEDELSGLSREEIVKRLLEEPSGPVAKLAKEHPLVLMKFSTDQPGSQGYTQPLLRLDMADPCPRRRSRPAAGSSSAPG